MHCPTFAEFQELARTANVIPIYRQLLADTLTPVSAFQKLDVAEHGFLLESVTGGESVGRYSLVGGSPPAILRAWGSKIEITRGDQVETYESDDPLGEIEKLLVNVHPVTVPGLAAFTGGAVGYLAYDVVRYVEDLPNAPTDDMGFPDIYLLICDTLVIFDHVFKTMKVVTNARLQGRSAREAYDAALARIDEVVDRLRTPVTQLSDDIRPTGAVTRPFESNFERADFEDGVRKCQEYICAGDIIQVVLSQRLAIDTQADPFDVYRTLRVVNPSPYMFYLRLGETTLVGASPEVMVKLDGDKITVRPIAGTRPRGADQAEDDRLADELL
ncbi:chorismate-binding protein, partial [bacterium]|nr:chorismate-binding protein [bacterium]